MAQAAVLEDRERCRYCQTVIEVREDGKLRRHRIGASDNTTIPWCTGGGKKP